MLLLGYGLVEVPRSIWHSASTLHTLHHAYFRAAKLSQEKAEANEHVSDLLQVMYMLYVFPYFPFEFFSSLPFFCPYTLLPPGEYGVNLASALGTM